MKTKIVYCIVSSEKDIYLEQAWASVYTLRKYNKDAHVTLLVDKGTEATLTGKRAGIRELVTEVVAVDTPEGYNAMQRSRFLKTNFRQVLTGDILFIDSDTVIAGSLEDIDKTDADIAAVLDSHRIGKEILAFKYDFQMVKEAFGMSIKDDDYYFNSGVIFVKDNEKTRLFFADWYDNWKYSAFQKNLSVDQPSLFVTNKNHGFIIKELSGVYNCQIRYSLKYLLNSVILHYFNGSFYFPEEKMSPFYGNKLFNCIKENGGIKGYAKHILDDKNEWLNIPTNIIDFDHLDFLETYVAYSLFESLKQGTWLYKMVKKVCGFRYFCKHALKISI